MTLRPREVELAVERPANGEVGAERVRLVARFEVPEGAEGPTPRELGQALDRLRADLDVLVGPPLAAAPALRPDRDLPELVDTYRPRQRELIDLLLGEGELTSGEHARLVEYLTSVRAPLPPPALAFSDAPLAAAPIAAAPIATERLPDRARSVPDLLRTYQIETLRQAGAVRARRQISFEEYMSLKRHFERSTSESESATAERSSPSS
ncbi:MAG: hypothetical protein L3J92_03680 [Thermoplasmata archaeon]|nr:hypothetical protein [Thermoplasmata archaeon]